MSTNTVIELKHPLKTPNGEVASLTLRRGTVRDLNQAKRQVRDMDGRGDLDTALAAILSEPPLTYEDMEGVDLADWANVQATFQSLL